MPKFSSKQDATYQVITDSLAVVAALATNDADKALLVIAREAARFASVWVRCNTESGGRGEMKAQGRALVERATTDSHTPVSFALMALGNAYQQFGSCEYRRASDYAVAAQRLAATPVVRLQEVMARA